MLRYFILNNATTNNIVVANFALKYNFNASYYYLYYMLYTLNLVGQIIIFSFNKDAYNNYKEKLPIET
jgi:hypothetical protein